MTTTNQQEDCYKSFYDIDIKFLLNLCHKAGKEILTVYNRDFDVEYKEDNSPLTEADKKSNFILVEGLKASYPDIPVLAEESKSIDYSIRKNWKKFWLVDPLDGTKEFIKRNGEFTVNVALIENSVPILGVIYAPVLDVYYFASRGTGSYKMDSSKNIEQIYASNLQGKEMLTIVGSRSHPSEALDKFVDQMRAKYKEINFKIAGSSLKLCLIAEGKADIYPRYNPTMEWDIAAGHIIVNESGKKVYKHNSDQELTYNKPDLVNGWFICR